ncbi:MAG: hypothetical protein R2730_09640 [Chitinophagales bacterium]
MIVAVVFLVYGNTLNHDYNLDDSYYIELLPQPGGKVTDIGNVISKRFSKSDYRPIPTIHLAVEQYLFGQKPSVFHFFNLFYYALLGIVFYVLFSRLKILPEKWAVLLLVVLFLIHPSHSNVVASIKNRDIILSMLYGLLGIITFLQFYDDKNFLFLAGSIVLFFISILCKVDGIIFPLMAMVLMYFNRNVEWKKLGLFVFAICIVVLGLQYLSNNHVADKVVESVVTDFYENPLSEDRAFFKNLPIKLYLTNYYHKFMLVPTGYYFYFGYNQISIPSTTSVKVIISVVAHLLVLVMLLVGFFKRRKDLWLMGACIYFISLIPLILFLDNTAGIVAVRYSFHASLGFTIVLLSVLLYMLRSKHVAVQIAGKIFIGFILIAYTYFTVERNVNWESKLTLFTHDLKYLKQSYMANRMGGIYFNFLADQENDNANLKTQYLSKATLYLNRAGGIYDKDPILWQNIGLLNVKKEEYKQAYFNFKHAISLDSTNIASWNYYASFCEVAKEYQRAEEAYRQIVAIDPQNALAYKNLTFTLIAQQKLEDAVVLNRSLLPESEMKKYGYENLGHIFMAVGDTINAISNFKSAFEAGLQNDLLERDVDSLVKNYKP